MAAGWVACSTSRMTGRAQLKENLYYVGMNCQLIMFTYLILVDIPVDVGGWEGGGPAVQHGHVGIH